MGETRIVMGIETIVVRDMVTRDGELVEDTFDWYAQDKEGNVWYFGEDARFYENEMLASTEGSWEAGIAGAEPGIIMNVLPQVGDLYRQEYQKGVAEGMAEVLSISESLSIAIGDFDNVLKIKEWDLIDPGMLGYKYYSIRYWFYLRRRSPAGW